MKNLIARLFLASCALLGFTNMALAVDGEFVIPTTIDMQPIYTWGGVVMVALCVMFVYRKLVKSTNRS